MKNFLYKINESFFITIIFFLLYVFQWKFIGYSWKDSINKSLDISFMYFFVCLSFKYANLYNF